jgi:hypothetical protein
MDAFTALDLAKVRIAQLHEEAARERLARAARTTESDAEQETGVWRRWFQRRIASRVSLAARGV